MQQAFRGSRHAGGFGSICQTRQVEAEDKSNDDPMVLLNVGGEVTLEVHLSTLRCFEGSHLAELFTGAWETKLPRDPQGRIFIDCRSDLFVQLVNFLRQCRLERNLAASVVANSGGAGP